MIRNLTGYEWDVTLDAFNLLDVELAHNDNGESDASRRRLAAERAFAKVRQLAPEPRSVGGGQPKG